MYDYQEKIKLFLNANFEPADVDGAELKLSNGSILNMLFSSFPVDCISDYDLYDILIELGFKQTIELVREIHVVLWCMNKK